MEVIRKTIISKEVLAAVTSSNRSQKSVSCWRCYGTEMRLRDRVTGEFVRDISADNAGQMLMAENCMCLRRKLARNQLAIIPPAFGMPRLLRLEPRSDLHPKQALAVGAVKACPGDSYMLLGKNRTGKTHIGWALYRHAIAQRRSAVACTVRELLAEFRRVEIGVPDGETLKSPRVTAELLRKPGKPWLLLLDEFEKARPTEFASEQLFNVLDAARDFNHQIVITSNLKAVQLREHWSRIDEIWGNSIMTRLENCHEVEMF